MTGVAFKRKLGRTYPNARLAVELAFGADLAAADPGTWTWVDVTTDVMYEGGPTSIAPMGRSNEASKAQPAGCRLRLRNTSGDYSKGLPSSPHFPYVRRNTPVRVSVQNATSPSIRSVATTTSGTAGSLAATAPAGIAAGDLVLAFHTADASYAADLAQPSGANWRLLTEVETLYDNGSTTIGYLATRVWWHRSTGAAPTSYTFTQGSSSDGVVSIVAIRDADMFTLRASTTSETPPGASFDTPTSAPLRTDDIELRWAAGSDLAGVAGVTWTPPAGLTERADAQSGNYTTATLATRTTGATTTTGVKTFTASSSALDWGHGVTVNLSNMNVRFLGYANGFVPAWDTSGKGQAVVDVSASGVMRRLMQNESPLRSVLYRSHVANGPVAYWPLEDGPDAGQGGNAVSGGLPFIWSGTAPTRAAGGPPGSAPLWTFDNNTDATGLVQDYTPDVAGWWGFQVVFNLGSAQLTPAATISLVPLFEIWCGGTIPKWRLTVDTTWDPDAMVLEGFDTSDTRVVAETFFPNGMFDDLDPYGHNIIFGMNVHQDGGNIHYDGAMSSPESSIPGATFVVFDSAIAGTNGNVRSIRKPTGYTSAWPDLVVGHISFWGKPITLYAAEMYGQKGQETVTQRMSRLASEEGLPLTIRGDSTDYLDKQDIAKLLDLFREAEVTDDGVLYDGRDTGLTYVTRAERYNAPVALTVDAAADPPQLGDPFRPADDDQRNLNKATVKRKYGTEATFEDVDGPLGTAAIGVYDGKVAPDPNYDSDSALTARGAHEVKKGTVDEPYRYPNLNLDLFATPELVRDWLLADVSGRIAVTNVDTNTAQHPPGDIDLVLEGWAESVSPTVWTVAANCSPFAPWRVAVIEGAGDTALIIDSGSSVLDADAAAGATSISVASDAVELWSTVAGDYPRAVDVGGVQVTVTAVSGAASPQTFTVDPLPYPLTAGAAVRLWRPPRIAL